MQHLKIFGKSILGLERKCDEVQQQCEKIILPPPEEEKENKENKENSTKPNQSMFKSPSPRPSQESSGKKPPNQPTIRSSAQTPKHLTNKSNNSSSDRPADQTSYNKQGKYCEEQTQEQKPSAQSENENQPKNSDTDSLISFTIDSDEDIPHCPPCPPTPECPPECLPDCPCKPKPKREPEPDPVCKSTCTILEKGINTENPRPISSRLRPILKNKKCQVHCTCKSKKACDEKSSPPMRKVYVKCTKKNCGHHYSPLIRYCRKEKNDNQDINLLTRMYNMFKQNMRNPLSFIEYLRSKGIVQVKKCSNNGRR